MLAGCGQKVEVTEQNFRVVTKDSIQLACTLTRPAGVPYTPLIILIHGSGNDSRQNEYYQMLTSEFCEIGLSVITYDKRGCDSSAGHWLNVPFSYLKDDVLTIVNQFEGDSTISKIGLWGGSEGSNVAVWAATESKAIDFVIAQSFTAMTFAEQNKYVKSKSISRYPNVSQQTKDDLLQLQDLLYTYVRTGQGYQNYLNAFNRFSHEEWFTEILGNPVSENGQWSHWYKTKMDIPNSVYVAALTIPALFIWGEEDQLIDVAKSMEIVRSANQNLQIEVNIIRDADHSLYAGGRRPEHLEMMKEWLTSQLK